MKLVLLAALLLCSCAKLREPEPKPFLATLIVSSRIPVVHFSIHLQEDWSRKSMWQSCDVKSFDFTLQQAVKFGLPPELWIFCLLTYGESQRVTIYFVPKVST